MKTQLKDQILEYCTTTKNIQESIYIIDDIYIDGEFDCGYRGLDHNVLLGDGYEWEDILTLGIVIVPETSTYISNEDYSELDELGYTRLPLHNNHIVGYN